MPSPPLLFVNHVAPAGPAEKTASHTSLQNSVRPDGIFYLPFAGWTLEFFMPLHKTLCGPCKKGSKGVSFLLVPAFLLPFLSLCISGPTHSTGPQCLRKAKNGREKRTKIMPISTNKMWGDPTRHGVRNIDRNTRLFLLKRMGSRYPVEYYAAMNRSEGVTQAAAQGHLESRRLRGQTHTVPWGLILFLRNIRSSPIHREREQIRSCEKDWHVDDSCTEGFSVRS